MPVYAFENKVMPFGGRRENKKAKGKKGKFKRNILVKRVK
jgi:hypothetical protein